MSQKMDKVIAGFLNLKKSEKEKIARILQDYEKYPNLSERNLKDETGNELFSETRKSFNNDSSVNFGPRPEGCPCCGK